MSGAAPRGQPSSLLCPLLVQTFASWHRLLRHRLAPSRCDPLFLFVGHFSYRIVAGQLFHYVCDAEARRLLARWKFLECLEQRSNSRLRRDESEHSIGEPLRIKDGRVLVGSLEWVAPQVEELGHAQRDERFHPDAKTMRALLQEMNLPLLVAQGHQIA